MSNQRTDAELIRICMEGTCDDFSDELVNFLAVRIKDSESVRHSILQSPHGDSILERLGVTRQALLPRPAKSSRVAVSMLALLAACLLGFSISWLMRDGDDAIDKPVGDSTADADPGRSDSAASSDPATKPTTETTGTGDATTAASDNAKVKDDPNAAQTKVADANAEQNPNSKPKAIPTPVKDAPKVAWSEAFDPDKPALTFEQAAWRMPGTHGPDIFKPTDFQDWFESIRGRPWSVSQENVASSFYTRFDGLARLKAPWVAGAVMRLAPYDIERCAMFFWRGDEGVRIQYYRNRTPHVWAAHRVIRNRGNAEINELLTSDNGAWSRCYFGTFEVRSQDGDLILIRGDLPFLKVALGGPPEEVILEGKLKLRQLEFYRSDPVPDEILNRLKMPTGRVVVGGDLHAHDWKTNVGTAAATAGKFEKIESPTSDPKSAIEASATKATLEAPLADRAGQTERTGQPERVERIVQLSGKAESTQPTWAYIAAPDAGLSEFVFRIRHADPGTGFYLGDEKGQPLYQIGYIWDPNTRRVAYSYLSPGQMLLETTHDVNLFPPAYSHASQFVRVVIGAGMLTTWVSIDGEHWGWMGDFPTRGLAGRHQTVGIYALPGADRHIELAQLEVREFPHVTNLAKADLLTAFDASLFEPLDLRDFGSWLHVVIRTKPANADFNDWRRTCAVQTLRRMPNRSLTLALWHGLLTDRAFAQFVPDAANDAANDVAEANPPAQPDKNFANDMWRLLAEAALFVDVYDTGTAQQLAQLYQSVVEQIVTSGLEIDQPNATDRHPNAKVAVGQRSLVSTEALTNFAAAPQWTSFTVPITPIEAAKRELIQLVQQQRHADVLRLIDRLVFWNSNGHPNYSWWSPVDPIYTTVAWAELMAHASLDSDAQTERISVPGRWKTTLIPMRHPLAQPVNKEAYNVMAEFNAALSGNAYNDACQVIASAGAANTLGLLPDQSDERLLIAFPKAIALAMERHPQLRSSMNDKYGAIGQLRVRESMQKGDARQIEAATVQFFGTIAAAECEQWLGDRAMAAGRFAAARKHFADSLAGYRRNSDVATAETRQLESRLQLVNAMLGEVIDPAAISAAAQFNSQPLTADQMKVLTTELSQTAAANAAASTEMTNSSMAFHAAQASPKLLAYEAHIRAKFDGDHGENAGSGAPSDVDWFSRQLAFAQEGQLIYLADRFQLRCLDLTNWQTRWKQELGAEHGNAHHWPLYPMRPLVTPSHVFYRQFTKQGPELACFDKASGNPVWKFRPPHALVSDPFMVRGHLQILASEKAAAGPVQIRLLTVHAQSGAVVQDVSVLNLLDETQLPEHLCQVTIHDDQIVFTVSGAVACCDDQGQTQWVREQSWTSPALDATRAARAWQPPISIGDRIIVSQPGVRMLECLDAKTGQIEWTYLAPQLKRIVGMLGNRIVLETQSGFESIDQTTGQRQWAYETTYLSDAAILAAQPVLPPLPPGTPPPVPTPAVAQADVLLFARHRDIGQSIRRPEFVWLDISTGTELAYAPLFNLDDRQPQLGPFISFQDKLFAYYAKGYQEPNRDLVEFTHKADGVVYRNTKSQWTSWLPETDAARSLNPQGGVNLARTAHQDAFTSSLPKACPGWTVSAPPQAADAGLRDNVLGRNQIFAVRLNPRSLTEAQQSQLAVAPIDAVRLVREVEIPINPNASLTLTVGHDKGARWQLIVEAEGCRVHSSIIDDKSAPTGWQDINLTFGHLGGKKVQLILAGAPMQPAQPTWVYLDNLKDFKIE